MYSEISLPALFGHFIALLHNPNNISTEAAKVGAYIEDEAIEKLAQMLGYGKGQATGHFTSGGTVANIEALWRARYRVDHFISLGCWLNLNTTEKLSVVQAAHMGWERYNSYLDQYQIPENELRKYSAVANSPWQVMAVYQKAFAINYSGPVVLVPNSKHYSWMKGVSLLGLGEEAFWPVNLDRNGILDINDLKKKIEKANSESRPVMMVVSVGGTTELGEFDPIHLVQDVLDSYLKTLRLDIWHHVDAAYGGYFCSMIGDTESDVDDVVMQALGAIGRVNSVTLDPHKLGYVPYACGAIIVRDLLNYRVSAFDAKYIQSPDHSVDRWMKTLEGSRSASGATATWMTGHTIGFDNNGYGKILKRTIAGRNKIKDLMKESNSLVKVLEVPGLNLLSLSFIGESKSLKQVNQQTAKLVEKINESNRFIVSKTFLKRPEYEELIQSAAKDWNLEVDDSGLVLLRLTVMNPFFLNKESNADYPAEFTQLVRELSVNLSGN
ncbi:pyridoxal phosphate-dependent decarboxylase family protein [Bdellovibrio svalbardensis]|uniref:Pyridoxal-dependent decarboxylase n=1 Tax=Bdellovibrio svalbardensis TaxID=2972972 RepID=A0ABT6DE63_9BACT|nr:pyridoxal-dependent decarboxylase [Bdellovibrio svalbardensis]MDG0814772.1 pyridoxal-dependent decarboxylase [Bdellovibrio svalbardensis]